MSNRFTRSEQHKMSIILTDPRKIKKVKLPSFPEAEIEMYDSMLYYQVAEIDKTASDYERGVEILRFLIKSWPFVDEKGNVLEVNKENLGKLPIPDVMVLMDVITKSFDFLDLQKKKSLKK